jgi:hypothetical protein
MDPTILTIDGMLDYLNEIGVVVKFTCNLQGNRGRCHTAEFNYQINDDFQVYTGYVSATNFHELVRKVVHFLDQTIEENP